MAYSQKSAMLFMAVHSNPHQVLVHKDLNDLLHLAFYTEAFGWHTPCGFQISAAPLSTIKYGKPTCFGCLLDDEDPMDAERSKRDCIKLYSIARGSKHVDVRMFIGKANQTLVSGGTLTLLNEEWFEVRAAIVLGAKQLGMKVILEER